MNTYEDLFTDVYKLEPKTGDVLVFQSSESADRDSLFIAALAMKKRLLDLDCKAVIISVDEHTTLERIPAEAMTEQGYVWRQDVRRWLSRHAPLGRQAELLASFDTEFGE